MMNAAPYVVLGLLCGFQCLDAIKRGHMAFAFVLGVFAFANGACALAAWG